MMSPEAQSPKVLTSARPRAHSGRRGVRSDDAWLGRPVSREGSAKGRTTVAVIAGNMRRWPFRNQDNYQRRIMFAQRSPPGRVNYQRSKPNPA
jgi:hypothetical protein